MPAIRDFTFSYETVTADAGLVIPVCAQEANDLLIAVCMADTGSLTTFTATPPAGWSILDEFYNSTPIIVYMKISGGSETDLTIAATTHATTNETYNGSMTSYRDIDTVTPVGTKNLSSYSESNQDSLANLGDGTTTGVAQSFATPAATANTNSIGCFASAKFYLKKVGSPTGNAVAKLYAHSGTFGSSSVPTGGALATSNNVDVSSLTGTLTLTNFVFSTWYQFTAGTNYVIAIEYSGGDASNYVQVGYDASSPGHAGNKSTLSGTWSAQSGHDCCFYAQRFSFNMSTQSASARINMPTITTDRNNTLVVYLFSSTASAGTSSFIEGPVTQIHGSDGSAEGHGLGWSFVKTAGTSPSTVYVSQATTGAGVKGVAQINAPSSGATVIPTYVVSDSCSYIDPIQGVTGFNGNTALGATADTNYGTTLGSYTANDATVAAVVDIGINSFHSMGGMTNAATANQVSGAEVVIAAANRFNLSTKNLLAHVKAATAANLQRHGTVAGGRGCWMGIRSNTGSGGATTGYKIWQVHGVGTTWGAGSHVPIIINNGAGNTKATSGTLDASVITSVGFWVSGIGALTAQMCFGMIWLMDVTVIAGGNLSAPIDISGIVESVGKGKERMSALQQGANQMLLLQDVQVGDGGTNSTYLDLNATAIEFPRQYNILTKQINYNSVDDKIGLLYYPGASDTIKHRNSIVSSQSRYKWGLHASASTSASYDFSGTAVIGAGTITLNKAITITGLTINNYSTVDVSGATLDDCSILNPPSTNDSITTNSSTNIDNSSITVSTVANGSRWCSVADPTIFNNNIFIGGGGHAIRITTSGTYFFVGNTFTTFGPAARYFRTQTDVNGTTDVITFDAAHGYSTGSPVYYQDHGGSNTVGLVDGTLYYIRNIASNQLAFYDTENDANNDTSRKNLTAAGSDENHYIYSAKAAIYNDSGGLITLNISGGGSAPSIRNSNASSTIVNTPVSVEITSLTEGSYGTVIGSGGDYDGYIILSGYANSSGVISGYFSGDTPQSVIVRARNSGIISAAIMEDNGTGYTNYTNDARDFTGANDVNLLPASIATNDAFYFGGLAKFGKIRIYISTAGTTYTLTWEYYNGSWSALTVTDPSNSFKTTGTHDISFTKPTDWSTTSVNSQGPYYYVRARVTAGTGTQPKAEHINLYKTTKYLPYTINATITGSGLTIPATWQVDLNADI